MNNDRFNKWFNAFILIGMTAVMVITTAIKLKSAQTDHALLIVAAFGALMGVLSTVCSANAKILTFLFGFFDVSLYGIMCFLDGKYGNAALHMLYFVPMQFVGFFQWRKRGAGGSHDKMKARRFKGKQWLWYSLLFLVGLALSYFILNEIGKSAYVGQDSSVVSALKLAVLMDAFSTMCNILGQLLMSTAYMEQWVFWIGVNISSVIMWSVSLAHSSDSYALIYLIKYSFYLLNSLNGLRIWWNLSKPQELT